MVLHGTRNKIIHPYTHVPAPQACASLECCSSFTKWSRMFRKFVPKFGNKITHPCTHVPAPQASASLECCSSFKKWSKMFRKFVPKLSATHPCTHIYIIYICVLVALCFCVCCKHQCGQSSQSSIYFDVTETLAYSNHTSRSAWIVKRSTAFLAERPPFIFWWVTAFSGSL